MTIHYVYAAGEYDTVSEVETAITNLKNTLDNNPTTWCQVKECTSAPSGGWIISGTKLSDSEILNLDNTKNYNVSSQITGENYIGLSSTDASTKITNIRTGYAQWMNANQYLEIETANTTNANGDIITTQTITEHTPSNEDMSGYV